MTIESDEILIGEGVRLDSGSAPVTLRILSGLIDLAVLGIAYVVLAELFSGFFAFSNAASAQALIIVFFVTALVLVPATVETLSRGRSLGRLLVGLRIVRDDGGAVSFRHAFIRAFVAILEVYALVGTLAVTVSLLSARGKRVGDYLAGTYALRTRGGRRALPPIAMPPSLESWARTADIRRLPDGLALTARLFLGRAGHLRPDARARLGNTLASEIDAFVGPPPPEGTHPETYLAAVLAARRDREYDLVLRQSARSAAQSEVMRRLPHGVPDVDN